MSANCRLLYCHCAYAQVVPKAIKHEVLDRLSASGVAFDAVPDLCEMSARKDPELLHLISDGQVKVAACYPRAVKWLLAAAGVDLPPTVEVLNMRVEAAERVVAAMLDRAAGPGEQS